MYIQTHIYACMYKYNIHTYICKHLYIHVHKYMHIYTCMFIYTTHTLYPASGTPVTSQHSVTCRQAWMTLPEKAEESVSF